MKDNPQWVFPTKFQQNSSVTIMSRMTGFTAAGHTATGVPGEGYWTKPADVTAIVCEVFDLDGPSPTVPSRSLTVPTSSVFDPPSTDRAIWRKDNVGFNFEYTVPGDCFPVGGHRYQVKFHTTFVGGETSSFQFVGPCESA